MNYITEDRQTIWDLATQLYGNVEHTFMLMADNPAVFVNGIDTVIYPGTVLTVRADIESDNKRNMRWFRKDKYIVATGTGINQEDDYRIWNDIGEVRIAADNLKRTYK